MKPGRISAAEIAASSAATVVSPAFTGRQPRLTAPATLTSYERALFQEQAALWPHLGEGDAPLLATYVQASLIARAAARDPDRINAFDKAVRLQLMIATKLRLTQQSRTDPKTLSRRMVNRSTLSAYERMALDEADES